MTAPVNARRLAALAGVAFVILDIAGGVIHGSPPSLTASAAQITHFYRAHHSAVIVSLLMAAIASVLLIVWAAVLAGELRTAGRRAAAGVLLASMAALAAVSVLSGGIEIGVAQTAVHSTNPSFVSGAYSWAASLNSAPSLFVALAAAAVVIDGRGVLPRWFIWLTAVVGVFNLLGGVAVGASGFFASNDGGAIVFAGLALSVWALAAGWVLWRLPLMSPSSP